MLLEPLELLLDLAVVVADRVVAPLHRLGGPSEEKHTTKPSVRGKRCITQARPRHGRLVESLQAWR